MLGDIIADAQLAATEAEANGGAVIAITNPGGIRNSILKNGDGTVTYADVFAAQPFRNQLVTMTLTGAQLEAGAGAAMDRAVVPAHPAGLARLRLHLRCDAADRRPRAARDASLFRGAPIDPQAPATA